MRKASFVLNVILRAATRKASFVKYVEPILSSSFFILCCQRMARRTSSKLEASVHEKEAEGSGL
jgi:hypothetical protein